MGRMIEGFIVILLGVILAPYIYVYAQDANLTGIVALIVGTLVPLVYAIGMVYAGLRIMGVA